MQQPTAEERELLQRAQDYAALVAQPGWKRLLDWMAAHVNTALDSLQQSRSSDERLKLNQLAIWQEREAFFQSVQSEVNGAIEDRRMYVRDFLTATRRDASAEEIAQMMEEIGVHASN